MERYLALWSDRDLVEHGRDLIFLEGLEKAQLVEMMQDMAVRFDGYLDHSVAGATLQEEGYYVHDYDDTAEEDEE